MVHADARSAPSAAAAGPIAGKTFVLVSHGTEHQPPTSHVWQFLMARGARRVDLVFHPLAPEDGNRHRHTILRQDRPPQSRSRPLPTKVPYTYPQDALWPLRLPRADLWLCFNNLLAARGLVERRLGRTPRVVYWVVDFVPDRFGAGSPLTRAYDAFDAYCCQHVDHRVEVTAAGRDARNARLGLDERTAAPVTLVPVSGRVAGVARTPEDGYAARRLVFAGHVVPRTGLALAIETVGVLTRRGVDVHLDVAGHGPELDALKARTTELGLDDRVTFHGFIDDHDRLERLLAGASISLAPYAPDPNSFTRFADPSKVKVSVASGLPTLMTDVPPSAHELETEAGVQVLPYDAEVWATAVERTLGDPEEWRRRRALGLAYAERLDPERVMERAFRSFGFA